MTRERELLDRAIGVQPPLTLDWEAVEAAGRRAMRRRAGWMSVGAVIAVAAVAWGGVGLMSRPSVPEVVAGNTPVTAEPAVRDIAYCYRSSDIAGTEPNQRIPVGISSGDVTAVVHEICADIWTSNRYGWSPTGRQTSPPPLVACVLTSAGDEVETGAVGVFPGGPDTCSSLGMAVADG